MKKFYAFCVLIVCILAQLQAQITLTQSNTEFTPGQMIVKGAVVANFTVPQEGADLIWNYTNLAVGSSYNMGYPLPDDVSFPSATYADTGLSVQFIPNKYCYFDYYYQTTENGVLMLGYTVKEQKYGAITANPTDSCIFPYQVCQYAPNSFLMPFPATMNSSWQSNIRNVLNFELTVSAFALNHAPCQKITNTSRNEVVVGWGKMRVPALSGSSLPYDVLMVKRTVIQVDSFYLNGIPAPAQMLTAFGVSQGQTTTSNRYLFWRENARYPLLVVNFGTNNFTTPTAIFFDGTAEYDPNSIEEPTPQKHLSVYPNPCKDYLYISSDLSSTQTAELTIYSPTMQKVYNKVVPVSAEQASKLALPGLKPGLYFIEVLSESTRYAGKLLIE